MIRLACYGLGPIGLEIVRVAMSRPGLKVVAAIDIAPDKAGHSLEELAGGDAAVTVSDMAAAALSEGHPDVVLHATGSHLAQIADQIIECLDAGAAVVSTCEELAFPWGRDGAELIHRAALAASRAVVGIGVNPGFVMDLLPALLTMPCERVERVLVERIVDLTRRRQSLQDKAGVGMGLAEFEELAGRKAIGHIGLDSSARLIAHALGLQVSWPPVTLTPLVDDRGVVYGFDQWTGYPPTHGAPGIELRLRMSARLEEPEVDRVSVDGSPPIRAVIEGGIFGDTATAALVVNVVPQILSVAPGLHTVLDIPRARPWKVCP